MITETHKATAKEYFEANPSEEVIHISTDGQVFFQKNYNDGVNHQRRLDAGEKLVSVYKKGLDEKTEYPGSGSDELPTDKWTNKEIVEWLSLAGVETKGNETKAVLLEMVAKVEATETEEEDEEEGGNEGNQ